MGIPNFSRDEFVRVGYAVVIYSGVCLAATVTGCIEALKRIKEEGKQGGFIDIQSFIELINFLGVPYYQELEHKYKR